VIPVSSFISPPPKPPLLYNNRPNKNTSNAVEIEIIKVFDKNANIKPNAIKGYVMKSYIYPVLKSMIMARLFLINNLSGRITFPVSVNKFCSV
jgi:hypothetical protein